MNIKNTHPYLYDRDMLTILEEATEKTTQTRPEDLETFRSLIVGVVIEDVLKKHCPGKSECWYEIQSDLAMTRARLREEDDPIYYVPEKMARVFSRATALDANWDEIEFPDDVCYITWDGYNEITVGNFVVTGAYISGKIGGCTCCTFITFTTKPLNNTNVTHLELPIYQLVLPPPDEDDADRSVATILSQFVVSSENSDPEMKTENEVWGNAACQALNLIVNAMLCFDSEIVYL